MGAHSFDDLRQHVGHKIAVVLYGSHPFANAAVECEDCSEVLMDFDNEADEFPDTEDKDFEDGVALVMDSYECDEREAIVRFQTMLTDESGSYSTVLARLRGEQD